MGVAFILSTLLLKPPLYTYLHGTFRAVYLLAVGAAVLYLFIIFAAIPTQFSVGWVRNFFSLMVLTILSVAALQWVVIEQGQLHEAVPFRYVLLALLYVLVPFVMFIKVVIDSDIKQYLKPIFGLTGFLVAEGYLLLLLGLYNIQAEGAVVSQGSPGAEMLRIMSFGAMHLFTFPDPKAEPNAVPFVQFFIGFLFNVLTVGFFTSYVSSLFGPAHAKEQAVLENVDREEAD